MVAAYATQFCLPTISDTKISCSDAYDYFEHSPSYGFHIDLDTQLNIVYQIKKIKDTERYSILNKSLNQYLYLTYTFPSKYVPSFKDEEPLTDKTGQFAIELYEPESLYYKIHCTCPGLGSTEKEMYLYFSYTSATSLSYFCFKDVYDTSNRGCLCRVPKTTVTFDGNGHGGTTIPESITVEKGSKFSKPTPDPTETGYTFGGWFKESECTNEWDFTTDVPDDSTLTLYAKWTEAQYSINYYDKGGGTFSGTHETGYPTSHTYGTATTLKSATKGGYTFDGWYKESDCSGTKVNSIGATEYSSGPISLYAKWSNAQYTINYYDKGGGTFSGSHESGHPTTHTYGTETTLKSATKTNHTFEGWYKSSDCTGTKVTSLGATEYTSGPISLYAKWTADVSAPTITSIGGYYKSGDNKQQFVGFGATFSGYDKLSTGDTCGIYVYSDSGSTVVQNFSTTDVAAVKAKEGRFYCIYDVSGGATYYAKGYVIISGSVIYSDLISASGNDTKEYTI